MQLSALTTALGRFVSELQRRKVIRVSAGYVVGAWIVLQVALALQTAMTLSASFSAFILGLLVIGFPIALGLSWFFEITSEGIKRTVTAGDGAPLNPQTTDFIVAGALSLAVIVAVAQLLVPAATVPTATAPAATTAVSDAAKPEPGQPALGDKSIAVLPFANLSTDQEDAVFADGLTEQVLDILAHVRGMKVISRTSSFAFKGKNIPVPEIAKILGVHHILEGSVRRDGDGIRVTAQLIDVRTDTHVWSQTYERTLADVFAVQDDIGRAIAGALNIELAVSAGSRGAPTTNMEAYRLYLRAREQSVLLTKDAMLDGIDLFKQAIKLDPKFAEAYAHMATYYIGLTYFDANRTEIWAKAQEAAETALKLDPNLGTAHALLSSFALGRVRDWEAALAGTAKALELEPSNTFALVVLGHSQLALGSFQKSRQAFEEVARVDPLFGLSTLRLMALALAEGDNATAEKLAMKLQSTKGLAAIGANLTLALVARERGDPEAAAKFAKLAIAVYPRRNSLLEPVSKAIKDSSWRARAIAALRDADANDPAFEPEGYYMLIGARDVALDSMMARLKSGDRRMSNNVALTWHLVARGEGANPKLKALLREMGLVDYWKKHGWPDRCRAKGEDDFECS